MFVASRRSMMFFLAKDFDIIAEAPKGPIIDGGKNNSVKCFAHYSGLDGIEKLQETNSAPLTSKQDTQPPSEIISNPENVNVLV